MTMDERLEASLVDALASNVPGDERGLPIPRRGIALCLSGGGYRAMLFHLGTLWRLNDAGYLPKLDLISSVSGGAITAAAAAVAWSALTWDDHGRASNFDREIVEPVRHLASRTIDLPAAVIGPLSPAGPGGRLAASYDRHLLHGARLSDLSDEAHRGNPRFVFNAANLQSGSNWRFSRSFMADHRVGYYPSPDLRVAEAVAASSAFPPFLSPFRLHLDPKGFVDDDRRARLTGRPFRSRVLLTDGGVYDNLGIEPAWKKYQTILVSDGGKRLKPQGFIFRPLQLLRILNLLDNQVRSRRRAQVVTAFKLRRQLALMDEHETKVYQLVTRNGAYWHMGDDLTRYSAPDKLATPPDHTAQLADIATRLSAMNDRTQERLINFGYAACDTHLRTWVDTRVAAPTGFPYPTAGVG